MTNSRKKASDCSGAGKAFPIRQVGAFCDRVSGILTPPPSRNRVRSLDYNTNSFATLLAFVKPTAITLHSTTVNHPFSPSRVPVLTTTSTL